MSATSTDENAKKEKQQPASELSTRDAYFAALNEWVKHANMSQNAQALFPWYLVSCYPQMFQQTSSTQNSRSNNNIGSMNLPNFTHTPLIEQRNTQTAPADGATAAATAAALAVVAARRANGAGGGNFNLFHILDEQSQNDLIGLVGGYECVIAPFWKRAVAEIIDVGLLLLVKILVIFSVMNIFDLDLGIELDKETLRKAMDDDDYASFFAMSIDFLALSSDLLMLEILTKIIVCFNEAIWTTMYHGATAGKVVMNLKIVYTEAIVPLQQQPPHLLQAPQIRLQNREPFRAILYPAQTPTFMRALMRALAKNLIMTLLFPMCFLMIFFKNNRTAYDIITKTVVIEREPMTRRPPREL